MDASQFFIQQELRKVESAASAAAQRLPRARTLREVLEFSHVSVPPTIRFMSRQIRGLRAVEDAAEKRAKVLVEAQLAELKALPLEEQKRRIGQLRSRDWMLLRGNFPRLAMLTERESLKLLSQLRSANPDATPGIDEEPEVPG